MARYIDWTPLFSAWELRGRFPDILTDSRVGEQASTLYADARKMLRTLIHEHWLSARAVIGLFPANAVDEDVEIYADEGRAGVLARLHFLRQQKDLPPGKPHAALSDFIAPKQSGVRDYFGAFAVTTGVGIERHLARFELEHDDYSSIILKALADRLAEAFAECLHERVRREFWGYAPDERFTGEQLIHEEYRGIRPAPGYPACPDHTEKATLWRLLEVEQRAGIQLTDSYAMYPTSAVSGWYFSHPQARYFAVGRVDRDQVEDHARQVPCTEAERCSHESGLRKRARTVRDRLMIGADAPKPRAGARAETLAHGRARGPGSSPAFTNIELLRGLEGMLRYGRRAVRLVWETNRRLLLALSLLTLAAGLLPAGVAAVGARIVDAVVTARSATGHEATLVLMFGAFEGVLVAAPGRRAARTVLSPGVAAAPSSGSASTS